MWRVSWRDEPETHLAHTHFFFLPPPNLQKFRQRFSGRAQASTSRTRGGGENMELHSTGCCALTTLHRSAEIECSTSQPCRRFWGKKRKYVRPSLLTCVCSGGTKSAGPLASTKNHVFARVRIDWRTFRVRNRKVAQSRMRREGPGPGACA